MTLQLPLSLNHQLSLAGELLLGRRAFDLGLVNHLVPQAEVIERAIALALDLTQLPAAGRGLIAQERNQDGGVGAYTSAPDLLSPLVAIDIAPFYGKSE